MGTLTNAHIMDKKDLIVLMFIPLSIYPLPLLGGTLPKSAYSPLIAHWCIIKTPKIQGGLAL
jgi:hypothetical protein